MILNDVLYISSMNLRNIHFDIHFPFQHSLPYSTFASQFTSQFILIFELVTSWSNQGCEYFKVSRRHAEVNRDFTQDDENGDGNVEKLFKEGVYPLRLPFPSLKNVTLRTCA